MNTTETKNVNSKRLNSLDALRGFDMFWIVGGGALVASLAKATGAEWLQDFALQVGRHVPWAGFRCVDLIFPLFMFISGAVIPYSIVSKLEKGVPKKQLLLKALKRMILLVVLGIIYNGTLQDGFSTIRYVSVLGQIGIAYFFAALIVLYTDSNKTRIFWLIGILLGVCILQLFVPVPGYGAGVLTPEGHINGFIDRKLLPGRLVYTERGWTTGWGFYDALGILSTVSSIGITLMGSFAGFILRSGKQTEMKKAGILSAIGAVLIIVAVLLHPVYPIIKNCWTTTFSLLTGGISFMLVALFYLVIDIWQFKKWSFFFMVFGMNPLFIYLFHRMVNIGDTSKFLFGWLTTEAGGFAGQWIISLGDLLLVFGLLYFLYKKKIFFKI